MIKKRKKNHNKIVLLAKSKLNRLEFSLIQILVMINCFNK